MTLQDQIDALSARFGTIERILNVDRFNSPRLDEKTWSETDQALTASGDLNVADNLRQLRIDWAKVREELKALRTASTTATVPATATTAASVPAASVPVATTSQPSAGTIPGLTAQQIATLNTSLSEGVNAGYPIADIRDRVKSELDRGVYSYGDGAVIAAVKLWRYNPQASSTINSAEDAALFAYLNIIDQRVPNSDGTKSNVTLPVGDPRWQYVSNATPVATPVAAPGPASIPDDFAASVVAALKTVGVFITNGRVGLGREPVQDTDALLTIKGGQIVGTNVGNWQNPGAIIENLVDLANSDGGMRLLQYHRYYNGKLIVSPATRPKDPNNMALGYEPNPLTTFAIDSHGDICVSDSRKPYGQVFYIVKDANGNVELCTYQINATLQLRESVSEYGDVNRVKI